MKYPWLDAYCKAKPGAESDFKAEWNAHRYMIRGKMFAMLGHDAHGRDIVSIKCPPEQGRFLREQYDDIFPGYYLNKEHWNSVCLDGNVPRSVIQRMIDMGHELIFGALSKKAREEIGQAR